MVGKWVSYPELVRRATSPQGYDYIIYKEGNYVIAKNGRTGAEEFKNANNDLFAVIQEIHDSVDRDYGLSIAIVNSGSWYNIKSKLTINKDNVHIIGVGMPRISVDIETAEDEFLATFNTTAERREYGTIIENLYFYGNRPWGIDLANLFQFNYYSKLWIRNVRVSSLAGTVFDFAGVWELRFDNNEVNKCGNNDYQLPAVIMRGVGGETSSNWSMFYNSIFENNDYTAVYLDSAGVWATDKVEAIYFVQNKFHPQAIPYHLHAKNVNGLVIVGNHFGGTDGGTNIYLEGTEYTSITGNVFRYADVAIQGTGAASTTIVGNVFKDNKKAIDVNGTPVEIAENVITTTNTVEDYLVKVPYQGKVANNILVASSGTGIYVGASESIVENNLLINLPTGIDANGKGAVIKNNSFINVDAPITNYTNAIIRDNHGFDEHTIPTSAPSNPVAGSMYFDPSTGELYIYDGSTWKKVTLT